MDTLELEKSLSKRQYLKYLKHKKYAVLEQRNGKVCVMPPERTITVNTSSGIHTIKTRTWLLN